MAPCKLAMSSKIKFINSVRNYPGLYNPTDKNYRDRDYIAIAWEEIVQDCRLPSVARAKTIWRNLRRVYKYGLNNPNYKKPEYYSALTFLSSFLKNYNYDDSDDEVQFILKKERSDDEENDGDTLERTSSVTSLRNRRRRFLDRRPSTSDRHSVMRDYENPSSSHQNNPPQVNQQDDLKLFMDSMYLMAKKLPPGLQRHARNQIFEIIKTAESSAEIDEETE